MLETKSKVRCNFDKVTIEFIGLCQMADLCRDLASVCLLALQQSCDENSVSIVDVKHFVNVKSGIFANLFEYTCKMWVASRYDVTVLPNLVD